MEKIKMCVDTIASTVMFLAEAFKGLVRPVVTLGIAAVFCVMVLKGKINAEVFMPVVMMILTFWFANREKEKPENGNGKVDEIKKP